MVSISASVSISLETCSFPKTGDTRVLDRCALKRSRPCSRHHTGRWGAGGLAGNMITETVLQWAIQGPQRLSARQGGHARLSREVAPRCPVRVSHTSIKSDSQFSDEGH